MRITASDIAESGAYEENGVLVFGVRLQPGRPVRQLIFQIDRDGAELEPWGVFVEIDGHGAYGAARFAFDGIWLDVAASTAFCIEVAPSERAIVAEMAARHAAYPAIDPAAPRGKPGRA
jgi:hypothetical protein